MGAARAACEFWKLSSGASKAAAGALRAAGIFGGESPCAELNEKFAAAHKASAAALLASSDIQDVFLKRVGAAAMRKEQAALDAAQAQAALTKAGEECGRLDDQLGDDGGAEAANE